MVLTKILETFYSIFTTLANIKTSCPCEAEYEQHIKHKKEGLGCELTSSDAFCKKSKSMIVFNNPANSGGAKDSTEQMQPLQTKMSA